MRRSAPKPGVLLIIMLPVLLFVLQMSGAGLVAAADNSNPTLLLSSPTNNQIYSEIPPYNLVTISGSVADNDDADKTYIRYSVNGGTAEILPLAEKDGSDSTGEYLFTHASSRTFAGTVDATDWLEGIYTIHVWAVDDQGGSSVEKTVSVVMDKTYPMIGSVKIVQATTNISLSAVATDTHLDPLSYRYIRRGSPDIIVAGWMGGGEGYDWNCVPNQRYTYDIEVRDKVGHVTRETKFTSTLALDPVLELQGAGDNDLTIKIRHDSRNASVPEIQLIARDSGKLIGAPIVSNSPYSTDSTAILTGLAPDHQYDIWAITRNLDYAVSQHKLLFGVWTNRPPVLTINPLACDRFSEVDGHRTVTLTGKVYDPDGNTLRVTAVVNGQSKSLTIEQAPTTLPGADNWTLSWDIVTDGLAEGSCPIQITVDDQ